ncbi:MAG: peptidylprolyl isomerase, partial [Parasphingopyxis sp.]
PDYRPDPELGPVLQLAFQMDEDDDPELVAITQDERFALVDVTQVAQTGPQPLQRIREIVSAQYIAERANRRARRVADGIVEKVNDGTPLTEAMAEAGVTLPPPEQVAMSRAQLLQMGENIPAPLELLFQMATDTAKLVRLPQDRGWFIVILDEIIASDEELPDGLIEQTREEFATITGNEYAQQFVNAVLADYPLTRDEAAIEALGARLTGRAP